MAAVSFASMDSDEEEIIGAIDKYKNLKIIIADPLFERLIKMTESGRGSKGLRFIPMPHEAFSGRIYRNGIYNLCLKCPEIN